MFSLFQTPRRTEDLALFVRHVAGAMEARVPLPDILRAYLAECEPGRMADAVADLADQVESGVEMSAAMEKHEGVFPALVRRLVRLGEQSRTLGPVMNRTAETLERGLESYERMRRAALYPLAVLVVLFLVVLFLMAKIMPKIRQILLELGSDMHIEIGWGTMFRWDLSEAILPAAMGILLLIIAFLAAAALGLRVRGFGAGRLMLQLPLVGPTMRLAETARFAHYLALLVENRVPMAEALEMLSEVPTNRYVRDAMADFQRRYESGEKLGDMLSTQPLFPPAMGVMVASAEDQGSLGQTLAHLAEYYDRRSKHAAQVVREVCEPLLLILVGLFVAAMLSLMYMPLFDLPRNIR